MALELVIPTPPSSNNLFATGRGRRRFKSRRYKQWQKEAGWIVMMNRPLPIKGRYTVSIILPRIPKNSDPDNRVKAVFDLLVGLALVESDTCQHNVGHTVSVDASRTGSTIVLVRPA